MSIEKAMIARAKPKILNAKLKDFVAYMKDCGVIVGFVMNLRWPESGDASKICPKGMTDGYLAMSARYCLRVSAANSTPWT